MDEHYDEQNLDQKSGYCVCVSTDSKVCRQDAKYPATVEVLLSKGQLKFIYSEKVTKFYEIFTLLLSYVVPDKSKAKILQNFVAFS